MKKELLKFFLFTVVITALFGLFFTSTDFITAPYDGVKDFFALFSHWLAICVALWLALSLFAVNKWVFLIIFPPLVLISSLLAYFRYTSNTILTPMILDASFNNDWQTSSDLISVELIVFVSISLCLALFFVRYRLKRIFVPRPIILSLSLVVLLLLIFRVPGLERISSERIPFNLYFMTSRYFSDKAEILKERTSMADQIICQENDSLLVVFVIGESLRADHLGINGYYRETTPLLAKEDIISFPAIYSEYTYTNRSIPHIMTRADSINPQYAFQERSFIDLFKHCKFNSSWLANQESAHSYIYFMHECDTLIHINMNKSMYVFDRWTDTDLLPSFDDELAKMKSKHLIILHTIGSHWYYNSHYTDDYRHFTPVVKSRIISSCTREEMINSYDNTVLYTDFFLYSVIDRLRNKNALLIYLSDHGENLGEDGMWMHATDTPPVQNPACLVWMSPQYKSRHPEKYEKLQANRTQRFRTDFLFHTITLAAGMTGDILHEEMSLFR